ncbi:hypothetical protein BDV98DRAFT_433505 [Pterulicium gracile]|uniref:Uncharacterized protein n=1 Tax=Pterulicium gracile TaxID=1884261 RepID=A0A5C3QM35_9AGAR|nr:hypothetical protein BDV98DRAFT_433505 [Pterula gracilis]
MRRQSSVSSPLGLLMTRPPSSTTRETPDLLSPPTISVKRPVKTSRWRDAIVCKRGHATRTSIGRLGGFKSCRRLWQFELGGNGSGFDTICVPLVAILGLQSELATGMHSLPCLPVVQC